MASRSDILWAMGRVGKDLQFFHTIAMKASFTGSSRVRSLKNVMMFKIYPAGQTRPSECG